MEVKIKLPEELKFVLIDESEVILKHHKLPALPVKNTVDKILDDYVETKSMGKTSDIKYEYESSVSSRYHTVYIVRMRARTHKIPHVLDSHFAFCRESTLEVTKGIREYFNITLGLQLLYKWERPQFIQIMNDNPETAPSQLYGAFHLLRLFGK